MPLSNNRKKGAAAAALLLATTIWGTSFPVLKIALQAFSPLWFIGIRFFIAAGIMFLFCIPRLKKINRSFLLAGVTVGVPVGLAYTLQTIGLMHTTAANNAFITATYVVIVPLLSWITGKKVKGVSFIIAIVTLGGLAVLSLGESFTIASGDIWTLGCAVMFAIHMIILGQISDKYDPFLLTLMQMLMIGVINFLLAVFLETPPVPADFTPTVLLSLAYCALFPSIACYLIQTWVQSILSPVATSVLMMSESVFGALFGHLILHEDFGPRKFIGAGILLTCMIISVLLDNKPQRKRLIRK